MTRASPAPVAHHITVTILLLYWESWPDLANARACSRNIAARRLMGE